LKDHNQVWIKLNAHVDAGIREFVEALDRSPKPRTISTCQGTRPQGARVSFNYGEDVYDDWKGGVADTLPFIYAPLLSAGSGMPHEAATWKSNVAATPASATPPQISSNKTPGGSGVALLRVGRINRPIFLITL
jgi:hypothetical protein